MMRKRSLFWLALSAMLSLAVAPSSAQAGEYLITIVSAQIAPKKSKFKRWDTGFGKIPLPDVFVVMEVAGKRFQTPVKDNTIKPTWNASWKLRLNGTERLYFQVFDKDAWSNDLIGKGSILMNQVSKPFAFGRVLAFKVTVERLDKPVVRKRPVNRRRLVPRRVPTVVPRPTISRPLPPLRTTIKRAIPVRKAVAPAKDPVVKRPAAPVRRPASTKNLVVERPVVPAKRSPTAPMKRPASAQRTAPPQRVAVPAKRAVTKRPLPTKSAAKRAAALVKKPVATRVVAPASRPAKRAVVPAKKKPAKRAPSSRPAKRK